LPAYNFAMIYNGLGMEGKKAANAILAQRSQEATNQPSEVAELTLQDFVEQYWTPYLKRKHVKPSTEFGYETILKVHILPVLGRLLCVRISPMQIKEFLRIKTLAGRSDKTVRNIVVMLGSVFTLAVENDLLVKSPVRKRHKPSLTREEKPVWSTAQIRTIINAVPDQFKVLFYNDCAHRASFGGIAGAPVEAYPFREFKTQG